jgi:hypothetical protein
MKSIGVNKLGHRKKLLKKISALRGENTAAGSGSHTTATSTAADSSDPIDEERSRTFYGPPTSVITPPLSYGLFSFAFGEFFALLSLSIGFSISIFIFALSSSLSTSSFE